MKIKDMCAAERPREKLFARGAEALSDGELLAILLRTGQRGESVLELAQRLLSLTDGSLSGLFVCDPDYLSSLEGIGVPKAATLLAAFELGRRFMQEASLPRESISESRQVFNLMIPKMKGLRHEECWLMVLDRKRCVKKLERMSSGGGSSTTVDSSDIIRRAVELSGSYAILIHNHPGGDPNPSTRDITETSAISRTCNSCGIRLLDHIIIADDSFYSFNEEKKFCI
ncbi:MAG: DNA repair protein RadC [Bacteroidales bacterium]|nr:DNA repair protein RadC [Bacteroidales bacterium]